MLNLSAALTGQSSNVAAVIVLDITARQGRAASHIKARKARSVRSAKLLLIK